MVGTDGGFGGGGAGGYNGGGGGGGYSGGNGGSDDEVSPFGPFGTPGGGGGSYVSPSFSDLLEEAGAQAGDGFVDINSIGFGFYGHIVYYVVPVTGIYDIVAAGAQGGENYFGEGYGAEVGGDILLDAGTRLEIVVGGQPTIFYNDGAGGGGGGSFVAIVPELSTWAMMLLGFTGLGAVAARGSRNRRRVRA